MKIFILSLTLLLAPWAQATVIEVNDSDLNVYLHPTPQMELGLQDLDSDGGLLYLNLIYDGVQTKTEIAATQNQYPNYQLQVITADRNGNVTLDVENIIHQEFPAFQQQLGPLVNTQIKLSVDQVQKIKKLGNRLESVIQVSVPAKVNYTSTQIQEKYQTDSSICASFKVQTVKELILNFGQMKRPEQIKNSATFDSLKLAILEQCFEVKENSATSFKELMNANLAIQRPAKTIVGKSFTIKDLSKSFEIKPSIKFEIY